MRDSRFLDFTLLYLLRTASLSAKAACKTCSAAATTSTAPAAAPLVSASSCCNAYAFSRCTAAAAATDGLPLVLHAVSAVELNALHTAVGAAERQPLARLLARLIVAAAGPEPIPDLELLCFACAEMCWLSSCCCLQGYKPAFIALSL